MGIDIEVVIEETDQPNLAFYFNLMYDNTNHKDAVVSMLGDDMSFITPGWDIHVLDAINSRDGKAVVFCDDGFIAHDKLCVNMFTTRELVESTQKPFMCPIFHAEMIDVVWYLYGQSTSTLLYIPNVIIKHDHDSGKPETERDYTFNRMVPLRQSVNGNKASQKIAFAWATVMACNSIKNGVGKWNVL